MSIKALQEYYIQEEIPTRWGDMDAFQHINNTKYLQYFENTRIKYFANMGIVATGKPDNIGPILASLTCRFRAPVVYPDTLIIGAKAYNLQEDRFEMKYLAWSKDLQVIAATGTSLIVSYDYENQQKAPIPAFWRESIERIEQVEAS